MSAEANEQAWGVARADFAPHVASSHDPHLNDMVEGNQAQYDVEREQRLDYNQEREYYPVC